MNLDVTVSTINVIICWSFFLLSIIMPLMHTLVLAKALHAWPKMYEIMLKYALFFTIGCACLFQSVSAIFIAYSNGQIILMQQSNALCYISIALLAFMSLFSRKDFWLATIIISTIWLWGIAALNVSRWILDGYEGYFLVGMILWQILVPCMLILFYNLNNHSRSRTAKFSELALQE